MTRDLRPLISPNSIAIIGASADPARVGGMPLQLLLQRGYKGAIYPVNPKYPEISGLRCYASVADLPEAVDLAVLAVAAGEVLAQLEACEAKGTKAAIIFAAGFAETGQEADIRLQERLTAFGRKSKMAIAGPNCMGFANLRTHAYTAFASVFSVIEPPVRPGHVALLTQSGNVCSAVYAAGRKLDVAFNYVINTGNESCLEFSEYLEFLADDPETDAVAGYVEGLRDGNRFLRVAEKFRARHRPLILLKTGSTRKGAEAAASHTAALAGNDAIYRTAFEQANVIGADDFTHMADLCYLSQFKSHRAGKRFAIITVSGALGALLCDQLVNLGCEVPTLPQDVQDALRRGIPDYGMVRNPVDMTGNVVNRGDFFAEAMALLAGSEEIDSIIVYAPGYLLDRLMPALTDAAAKTDKLISAIDTGEARMRATLEEAGIPVFLDVTRAVKALTAFGRWQDGLTRETHAAANSATVMSAGVRRILKKHDPRNSQLTEVEGKALLRAYGIPVVKEYTAATREEAVRRAQNMGFPVVLKVLSPDIVHKSEAGGVKMNLMSSAQVTEAFGEIMTSARHYRQKARIEGCVVQTQEQHGAELLVGITRDPVFGLVMTAGFGGVLVELLGDVSHRLLPVNREQAERVLRSLKSFPVLDGYRGGSKRDVAAVCEIMERLSNLALEMGDTLEELEINPLIVRAQGAGAVAVDCLVRLNALSETAQILEKAACG